MLKYQWTDGSSPERSHKSQKPSQKPVVNDNVDYTNQVSSVVDPCMMKPPTTNMIPDLLTIERWIMENLHGKTHTSKWLSEI